MTATLDRITPLTIPEPRELVAPSTRADTVFRAVVGSAGAAVLGLLGLIGLFLLLRGLPALRVAGFSFITEQRWLPDVGIFGVASLVSGTFVIGLIAIALAMPLALGVAIFITDYAGNRASKVLVTLVDLMAAVPSIVYGLWGFFFVQPHLVGVSRFIAVHVGNIIPFLSVKDPSTASSFTSSAFIAGVVVAVMVIPTAASVMRETFAQTPVGEREGAVALGATRWVVVRRVVIPFGRSGIVGGTMLALGRAIGETIAVLLIVSPMFEMTTHPLQSGTNTISAHIAARASESTHFGVSALLAAGLVLFLMTLVVNSIAAVVVSRSRSGASTEI